jgi:RNA polymerase sigma-70 factor (ECF subfamily)
VNERSDENLVAASREGDRQAFGTLVGRHRRRVFATCLALLGNQADAEDATQEVFVKALERLHTLRGGGKFESWTTQIARNRCRDLLRQGARRRHVSLAEAPETAAMPARGNDGFSDLRTALDRLPEEYRLPLLLFYFDGRSTRKLAEELDLSEGGACARLYRARKALRKQLAELEETGHA